MALDLSRLRRSSVHDRRPWHGAAFIVESLVLLVFLMASLAVLMQVMGNAHERGIEADKLSNAIILASNDAEAFSADPTAGDRSVLFSLVDGELIELTGATDDAASTDRYQVERTVQQHAEKAGTLYEAHIEVSSGGNAVYEVNTSRYVSGEEVQR
ncbi:hypothetical protein [Eggerthella sinensis]|uniref:hypothetical protein n=1 Tax=Eggerthella sinensis TaxID=242230 RepID=UPI0022E19492|nr:hypothetical protein [Eggerthella sinensis]